MTPSEALQIRLADASQSSVLLNHPMSEECSFRVGGQARYFCRPTTPQALLDTWQVCHDEGIPQLLMGGGANILFRDEGFPGVVISTANLTQIEHLADARIRVGAGLSNTSLTHYTVQNNLTGFEWASDLPGSIGGGIYMNAKCYGACFSEIISEVTTLAPDRTWHTFSNAQCQFDYKHSVFQKNGHIIVDAVVELAKGDAQMIIPAIKKIQKDRQTKGQFAYPSAGCVFKNNYTAGIPSGQLIESCGLKGHQIGDVKIYEAHANFIINLGNGKTRDIIALMQLMEDHVWEKHHIRLEPEIKIVP